MSEWIHTANVSFFFATLGGHMAIKWESRVGPETGWIAQRPYRVSKEAYPNNGTLHQVPKDVRELVMQDFQTIRHMVPNIRRLVLAEHRENMKIQTAARAEFREKHGYGPR